MATPKRKLEAMNSGSGSDDEEPSPDSGEEEEGSSADSSLRRDPDEDGEESDVDVDAPRVAQWVDDEDLEELELLPGDTSHGKAVDAEDVVRVVPVSPNFGWFIVFRRKSCRIVRQLTQCLWGTVPYHTLSQTWLRYRSVPCGVLSVRLLGLGLKKIRVTLKKRKDPSPSQRKFLPRERKANRMRTSRSGAISLGPTLRNGRTRMRELFAFLVC